MLPVLLASGSHVSNAVFVTATLKVVPHGISTFIKILLMISAGELLTYISLKQYIIVKIIIM